MLEEVAALEEEELLFVRRFMKRLYSFTSVRVIVVHLRPTDSFIADKTDGRLVRKSIECF